MANYVFSDLHGSLNAWRAIQERTNDGDRLYCLGDAADRGPDGYQILKELFDDPRVIYLKGNHDDMFVEGVLKGNSRTLRHWIDRCGGWSTFDAWGNDGQSLDILEWLDSAPEIEKVATEKGLILLSHAGYTPHRTPLKTLSNVDFIWGREHFLDPWELGDLDVFVVHGHTPVSTVWAGADEPVFYADGHKVNIDLGTYFSYRCALMCLDDFSYEVFRV